uniref:EF-hand domain-containing protein n=1 Tax=Graphocephala atropunctata TaxID=36148 RepID=A0A1B6KUQ2_9HEMI
MSLRSSRQSSSSNPEEELPVNELGHRITEVFEIYDHGGNKTVDVKDVGTIIRSLGCCPTEAEVKDILALVEDPDNAGSVPLKYFLPVVTQTISDFKMQPSSPEEILQAFRILDKDGKGSLGRHLMSKALMEQGEPLTRDEVDEMMTLAVDPETGDIPYEYYINQLVVNVQPNIYSLVPKKSVVKKRKLGEGLV